MENPLVSDRNTEFLLYEVFDAPGLCKLPYFADHSRETFDMFLDASRRLARGSLYAAYKPMDEAPPVFANGRMTLHPLMKTLYPKLIELGVMSATRPADVGGQQLPHTVASLAHAYLMAANLSAYGLVGLSTGAAHLLEAFGSEWLKQEFMTPIYDGKWTGTMALTEPGAGSSLSDVSTKAVPAGDGTYRITGTKIFISGADHDITPNVVNMTLARIEGAPAGIKGVSLFAVPRMRPANGKLVFNDVNTAGAIHKIGWRGLPSLVLNYGESNDCVGWLVGEPNKGISYMFQMMNEARMMVGLNGVSTASVAYHESLAYAQTRLQGRPITAKDPKQPQVPLVEHTDVRRMLLRQKAIVEGGLALLTQTSWYADQAAHAPAAADRKRAFLLLDLLTPVAKTFPAEWGFESNALAVQIHGGYGYSSEYPVEAWLRDQKLNSIHEGTSGIQSLDLLGRKAMMEGGAAVQALFAEFESAILRANVAGVDKAYGMGLQTAAQAIGGLTLEIGQRGLAGDIEGMLRHSFHYLQAFSIAAIGWQWLLQAAVAAEKLPQAGHDAEFYKGKLAAAKYWFAVEMPRIASLVELCARNDDSYATIAPASF